MPEAMGRGNPDAVQDEELILSVMERNLGPIFQAIGSRLKDLEEDLGETKDLLFKFTEGLIGAADNHRRTSLSSEISSKYGKDIEPFDGFYKDTMGKGFSDSLIEELMGENAPDEGSRDEFIKNRLGEARGKYGKYVGYKEEVPLPEAEVPEETGMESEEEASPEGEDSISKIQRELFSVGGKKHSLSSKKTK